MQQTNSIDKTILKKGKEITKTNQLKSYVNINKIIIINYLKTTTKQHQRVNVKTNNNNLNKHSTQRNIT